MKKFKEFNESIRTADFDAKNIARKYSSWKDFAGDATKGQAMTLDKLMVQLKTKDKDYANDVLDRIKKILRGY